MAVSRVATAVILGMGATLWFWQAQAQYTGDGTPTGLEEEIRWRLNRGRFDSGSENQTRGTAYTDVPATSGPLAPNQSLTLAARHHTEDMATHNLFQHATVPGSAYYNATTQPNPWDRMTAEGYTWNNAAENIAAGFSGAEAVYVGWWNSAGHRVNMYTAALREIGNGYYYWSSSTYGRYYTMDLGSSGSTCFFTDTLFWDVNGNGTYEQAEAAAGIYVRLRTGSTQAGFDISSSAGSYAVQIQSISSGATVQVVLSNAATTSVTLSIPRDYRAYSTVTLAAGESRVYGTFVKPATTRNVGLRNVTPTVLPINPPRVFLTKVGGGMQLGWLSEMDLEYQPQWSTNSATWNAFTTNYLVGTASNMVYLDAAASGKLKYYRLAVRRP